MSDLEDQEIGPNSIVLEGKYTGHTFQQILSDSVYCQSILLQMETDHNSLSSQMHKLARFIAQSEWNQIPDIQVSLDEELPDL